MTLAELVKETLVEKHIRLKQEKCRHEETWSSTFLGPNGGFTKRGCFDCGKFWHIEAQR